MSREDAIALWDRARQALSSAEQLRDFDPESSASRSYYAAFFAVSAWFALRDIFFKKHSAVRAAVNLELVRAGLWPQSFSKTYAFLLSLRSTADYGMKTRVSREEAEKAAAAHEIIEAVSRLEPAIFSL